MSHAPHGWQTPTPPRDLNGWGHYMTRSMEHVLTRLYYVEQSHNELREEFRSSKAQESAKPAEPAESMSTGIGTAAKEVGIATKELGLALRWVFLIVVVILLATKRLDLELLSKVGLGRLLSGA